MPVRTRHAGPTICYSIKDVIIKTEKSLKLTKAHEAKTLTRTTLPGDNKPRIETKIQYYKVDEDDHF